MVWQKPATLLILPLKINHVSLPLPSQDLHNVLIATSTGLAFSTSCTDPNLADTTLSLINELVAEISRASAAKGKLLEFQFMNDTNHLQNPIGSYGKDSVAHLQSVCEKYDFEKGGLFQNFQNDGLLLSKM